MKTTFFYNFKHNLSIAIIIEKRIRVTTRYLHFRMGIVEELDIPNRDESAILLDLPGNVAFRQEQLDGTMAMP
jgi:hypothetical protein